MTTLRERLVTVVRLAHDETSLGTPIFRTRDVLDHLENEIADATAALTKRVAELEAEVARLTK